MSYLKGINNSTQTSFKAPKLIRDNIVKIIKKSGKDCIVTIEKNKEFLIGWLAKKLEEELMEFRLASEEEKLEEAADMYEVCLTLWENAGLDLKDIQTKALEKKVERGGFKEGIILWDVLENNL